MFLLLVSSFFFSILHDVVPNIEEIIHYESDAESVSLIMRPRSRGKRACTRKSGGGFYAAEILIASYKILRVSRALVSRISCEKEGERRRDETRGRTQRKRGFFRFSISLGWI